MKQEDEIRELRERLAEVEEQLDHQSDGSKLLRNIILVVISVFLLLFLVGMFQFVSASSNS